MNTTMLYKDWLKMWLSKKAFYVKEATYANYATEIGNHIIPALGNLDIGQVTEEKIQETVLWWLENGRMDKKGGLSEKTVRDLTMIIKLSLKAAAKEGYIPLKPIEIYFPKNMQINRLKVFSAEEQKILTQYIGNNPTSKSLGILFCLHTGVRIGELCALQWKDIDFKHQTVSISKTIQRIFMKDNTGHSATKVIITTPKTRSSIRIIPVSSVIYSMLEDIRSHNPEAYLLTNTENYTEPRTYRSFYDRLLKQMNIEHINFHGLRHTFVTRLIENGADYKTVSELLGHSSVNMTLNLYVHPQIEQKRRTIELLSQA